MQNLPSTMDIKSELKYVFENVNSHLRFAEAKHGGLLVLNSGLIIGIISSYNNIRPYIETSALLAGLISLGISIALSLVSQFPVTHNNLFYTVKKTNNPNLYFFKSLSHLSEDIIIDELKSIDNGFTPNKFDKDLLNQIIVNSRITNSKFNLFKYASYLTAFGSGLITTTSLGKIIWHF